MFYLWFFFGKEEFRLTVIRNSVIKLLTLFSIFMFIPTYSAEIPLREINVHKELLNPFQELAFDLLIIVQVVIGSLMFVCIAHNLVIYLVTTSDIVNYSQHWSLVRDNPQPGQFVLDTSL